jgi:hypothetical protein
VAVGGTSGPSQRNDLCRRCGTVIDFLSTCPSCGTVAGIDPTLADGANVGIPKLTLVAPPVDSAHTPPAKEQPSGWVPPRRSALPEELVRAWDISAVPKVKPSVAKRRRRALLGIAVLLVVAGVAAGVVVTVTRGTSAGPPPVTSYQAPGAPFRAAFPAPTVETHATLRLVGIPYESTAYTAFSGSQMFSATVYPFPLGKPTMTAVQFLRKFTHQVAAARELSVPGSTPTVFRGLPALSALLVSPHGGQYTKLLAVLDGHIAYVLMVSGTSQVPPGYGSFVSSFRLISG